MNHRITFPSVHGSAGRAFVAEVEAPTEALAQREVLEHCARESIPLEFVVIANIDDLRGARLDGLRLSECRVHDVNLSGASLTGAHIEHTGFLRVVADDATRLDAATLYNVTFGAPPDKDRFGTDLVGGCLLSGMSLRGATCTALRFEFTTAQGLNVEGAVFDGLRQVRSDLSGWLMHMAYLKGCKCAEEVVAASAMTENQKAAVRTLAVTGSRTAAEKYLADLEAQSIA